MPAKPSYRAHYRGRRLLVCRSCRALHRPRSIPNHEMAGKARTARPPPIARHPVRPFSMCAAARSWSRQNAILRVLRQNAPAHGSKTPPSKRSRATGPKPAVPCANTPLLPLDIPRFCQSPSHRAATSCHKRPKQHQISAFRPPRPDQAPNPCLASLDQGAQTANRAAYPPHAQPQV